MLVNVAWMAVGFVLLFTGADRLVNGSARLAMRIGISPLIIGLTIVAFGTSTPELFVSMKANLAGRSDIACGNIVGSNIFNLGMILGLSALIRPITVKSSLIRQDIPVLIAATMMFFAMAHERILQRWEGALLFAALLGYLALHIRIIRRGPPDPELTGEIEHNLPIVKGNALTDTGWMVVGLILLVIGSEALITSAVKLAQHFNISEAIIALTIIAAGTGLPELATSLVAAIKKEADIAVGNIIGSNIFNLLCIGGLTPLVKPMFFGEIEAMDFLFMTGLTLMLFPISWSGLRIGRREGLLLLGCYGFYLYTVWP